MTKSLFFKGMGQMYANRTEEERTLDAAEGHFATVGHRSGSSYGPVTREVARTNFSSLQHRKALLQVEDP